MNHVLSARRLVSREGLRVSVARVEWESRHQRALLPTEFLIKTCDVEGCVTPEHFRVSTRTTPPRTRCPNGHLYTESDWTGSGHRCAICREQRNERRRTNRPTYWQMEAARTHCPQGHEYTPENTYRYGNKRKCKICTMDRAKMR